MAIRVLIVDDTILFRKILADALKAIPGVEVVGTANNGKIALSRIQSLAPDLLLLDLQMPEMDGLAVLSELKKREIALEVIVVSSLTREAGDLVVKALAMGAFEVVTKPSAGTLEENRAFMHNALAPLLHAVALRKEILDVLRGRPAIRPAAKGISPELIAQSRPRIMGCARPDLVVLGVSTGGPNALSQMLPGLPGDLRVPLLIVQHMPALFTLSLAQSLSGKCEIAVKEAEDGEEVVAGKAYIAPGGRQMKLQKTAAEKKVICIQDDPPENNCRPSVDYLFRSVAHHFPGQAAAVIMTGMGSDGVLGLKLLKRHGCLTIAQDERSSVVFGMSREAIKAGVVDIVSPLDRIAQEIVKAVR